MTSDATVGERAPLLSGKAKRSRQGGSLTDVDVIERLESLPILLVRATAIFTMAVVTSTVLGAVSVTCSLLRCRHAFESDGDKRAEFMPREYDACCSR